MVNEYTLSLDVSTTNIGMALWDNTRWLVELKHLQLKISRDIIKEERFLYKADIFRDEIEEYKNLIEKKYNGPVTRIFIEAPITYTPKNRNTIVMLYEFNGICCYILYKVFGFKPLRVPIHDARKIFCPELITRKKVKGEIKEVLSFPKNVDKKHYLWQKVCKMEPKVEWFYKKTKPDVLDEISYDMSDAYVVGYSGLKVLEN